MKKTIAVLCLLAFTAGTAIAESKTKISVFPLKPSGGKEAEDLSRAIQEIMLAQLIEKDTIIAVSSPNAPADDKDAAQKAIKEGSDYAVTGGMAVFGKTSNLSIRLIDAKTASSVQAYSKIINKQEEIPEAINGSTQSIKSWISSKKPGQIEAPSAASPKVTPPPVQVTAPVQPQLPAPDDQSLLPATKTDSQNAESLILIDPIEKTLIFKTAGVDERIISIAPVNLGKNTQPEIVALTRNQTLFYKKAKNTIELSSKSEPPAGQRNLRVDAIDMDGDGKDEIFTTCLNTNFMSPVVSSNTIEGGKLVPSKSESGFFSATAYFKCKKILLIQKEDRGNNLYSGEIFQITGKSLDDRTVFKSPTDIHLDNFIFGQITEKPANMWLNYDSDSKMALRNEKGEAEWEGDEKFGGSMESMEKQMEGSKKDETERKYFKQRLIGFCDQSGRTYILTVKNEDIAKGMLSGYKKFTSGKAIIYGWSGIGLKEIWSSEAIPGGIHDFCLYDVDGDGLKDIVFAASIESAFKSKGYLAGIKLPEKIAKVIK
ncbi:FG-GAP repeat domain-containing protein [Desulforegula conservatrix]|uniref:FG-GAP repeat domain-containing protein n=1 Tax=Desulforegula conservatrix TaxID=153026 RepID=UPI00040CC557|nr:VCBS repeat-containing protein [Desulforegula conservatrix]